MQNTAISDRPKAKPVSKKEGKNNRKQQQYQPNLYGQQQGQMFTQIPPIQQSDKPVSETLNVQGIDLDSLSHDPFILQDKAQENPTSSASVFQQYANSPVRAAFVGSSSVSHSLKCF